MSAVTFAHASRIFAAPRGTFSFLKQKPTPRPAVNDLCLDIADGEFLVLVGPSGCGKSTSLRMLAGLEPTDSGQILIDGQDTAKIAPRDRDVAMVFQNYALYPNMSVANNMAFALRNRGVNQAEIATRVKQAAQILELEDLLDRKPAQLSGGQRQRVAMGRAIVREPAVFCMDEPLSNLDAKLRVSTRSQISTLQKRLGTTTIYVTHDQVEAMTMGDRVAVLKDGELQQVAAPRQIYDAPVNKFVASFLGSPTMNFFDCPVVDGHAHLGQLALAVPAAAGARVSIGVRPEAWVKTTASEGLPLVVSHVEELGAESFGFCHQLSTDPAANTSLLQAPNIAVHAERGEKIQVGDTFSVIPTAYHVFDPQTTLRLPL